MTVEGKLLVLGAGVYQVPLIETAKRMGLRVTVATVPGPYPGIGLADEVLYEDIADWPAICSFAEKREFSGVCTAGTDVCVPSIGAVCDVSGLSGPSFAAAFRASNKIDMKRAFLAGGVRTARFAVVGFADAFEEVSTAIREWGFPVVLKCADSSGSRGIVIARSLEDIEPGIACVRDVTKLSSFIVEEFIEGTEFGAQALVQNGTIAFSMLHADIVHKGRTGVPVGHYAPYGNEDLQRDACEQIERAVRALGLDNCALNFDFIERDGRIYVLEVGARSGATGLAEMVSVRYGIDYYHEIVRLALGLPVGPFEEPTTPGCVFAELLRSPKAGVVERVEKRLLELPGETALHHLAIDVSEGDAVNRFEIGPDRIGLVVVSGPDLPKAQEAMAAVQDSLAIVVDEDR